jgi:hypothetical protein
MTQNNTSHHASSAYHYLHFTLEELAHLPPDELLQASLESRSLLQIIMGILSTPDAIPTERVVACDLVYTQAIRMAKEQSTDHPQEVVADIKAVSERLGLRPIAVRTAYEALAKHGAVRIDDRILPKTRFAVIADCLAQGAQIHFVSPIDRNDARLSQSQQM